MIFAFRWVHACLRPDSLVSTICDWIPSQEFGAAVVMATAAGAIMCANPDEDISQFPHAIDIAWITECCKAGKRLVRSISPFFTLASLFLFRPHLSTECVCSGITFTMLSCAYSS
jgi:hypothetical protein